MTRPAIIAALAVAFVLAGCKKGEGLVIVNLSAAQPISGVTAVVVTRTDKAGPVQTITSLPSNTISTSAQPFFAIDVSADSSSTIALHVDAMSGAQLVGSGAGTTAIRGGKSSIVSIALTPGPAAIRVCSFDDPSSTFAGCVFRQ